MNIPEAAIKAAAPEIQRVIEGWMNYDDEDWTVLARTAIEAAMPAICEAIAQKVEAQIDPEDSEQIFATYEYAAHIVRGGV